MAGASFPAVPPVAPSSLRAILRARRPSVLADFPQEDPPPRSPPVLSVLLMDPHPLFEPFPLHHQSGLYAWPPPHEGANRRQPRRGSRRNTSDPHRGCWGICVDAMRVLVRSRGAAAIPRRLIRWSHRQLLVVPFYAALKIEPMTKSVSMYLMPSRSLTARSSIFSTSCAIGPTWRRLSASLR